MSEQINPTKKKYDVAVAVKMPGQTREQIYHLQAEGYSPIDAMSNGIAEWKRVTEPRNVQVKEVTGVQIA